jgi:hypothetical protein
VTTVEGTSVFTDAGEESGKGEDDEWESQQIRKGVSGAQVGSCTLVIGNLMFHGFVLRSLGL